MSGYKPEARQFDVHNAKFAIVSTRWNREIIDVLEDGAKRTLLANGVAEADISHYQVPGAFELPLAVKKLADSARADAVIALGAVIRGGTPHFEYVAGECTRGLGQVALDTGVPVAFGVLTVDNLEQAQERANPNGENKGEEAALAALEMVDLLRQL